SSSSITISDDNNKTPSSNNGPSNVTCPRMLRDLLVNRLILSHFNEYILFALHILMGSPSAFNLRNLYWHGFLPMSAVAYTKRIENMTSLLILIYCTLVEKCELLWKAWRRRVLKRAELFPADHILSNYMYNNLKWISSPSSSSLTSSV